MNYHILLVEDDPQICEIIIDYFSAQNIKHTTPAKRHPQITFDVSTNGDEGLEHIYEQEYDLAILDVMLPGTNGFSLCQTLRQISTCPIIFLTARGLETDILSGYNLGCDDYMVKPFSIAELYAKVQALLKRSKGLIGTEILTCGGISLNPARFLVKTDDISINLPPKEYSLLKYLIERKGCVVTREMLLFKLWGYDYEGNDRVVDNHIKKLRKALGPCGKQIKTVITKGYKLDEK